MGENILCICLRLPRSSADQPVLSLRQGHVCRVFLMYQRQVLCGGPSSEQDIRGPSGHRQLLLHNES